MTESLVKSPFAPSQLYNQVTLENWKETAIKALKGAEFDTLEKTSDDGIAIHPLYTSSDVAHAAPLSPKGTQTYGVWDIRQSIVVEDAKSANAIALEELQGGANSIDFEITEPDIDMAALIDGIHSDLAFIGLVGYEFGLELAKNLIAVTPSEKLKTAHYAFNLNPTSLGIMGFDSYSIDDALEFYTQNNAKMPNAKFFLASSNWMMEIGASRALQVAILIASGLEYLRQGEAKGISPSDINKALIFKCGTDGQVILEIAKLRAMRMLWAKITASFGEILPMDLQAVVSNDMLEEENPHTNILRIANACFAAGTAGANIISTQSFEPNPEKQNEFTRRIARNSQIVLANESNIARVDDPASGSFAFEALTNDIAQNAWSIIQEIDAQGGFAAALTNGFIAKKLGE